ncbi:hypothetical protein D3C77_674740 [compost metagenome]
MARHQGLEAVAVVPDGEGAGQQQDHQPGTRAGLAQPGQQQHQHAEPEQPAQQAGRAQQAEQRQWKCEGDQQGEVVGVGEQPGGAAIELFGGSQHPDQASAGHR